MTQRRHRTLLERMAESLAHPLSYAGAVIAFLAGALIVTLIVLDIFGLIHNPYIGALTYLLLPAFFILGLVLIPLGTMRAHRREAMGGETESYPVMDLNNPGHRRRFVIFGVLTIVNIVIVAAVAYRGVEFMDSVTFCGKVCHSVMRPEHTAYQLSPHARVRCVDCHIGRGAGWYVRSKLSGVRQVFAVTFHTYSRPIPTPVHNLRPARETCEECHWPAKFHGDRIKVKTHFKDDEANTPIYTVLVLKVGGGGAESGFPSGIHWHVANEVRYTANKDRERIYDVSVHFKNGQTREFKKAGGDSLAPGDSLETRVLDCVDCHNRPTHIFQMPDDAVDAALVDSTLDRALPYVRREGVRLLRGNYLNARDATAAMTDSLRAFYGREYPDVLTSRASSVDSAAKALATIWQRNIFPNMDITWGTYPNHIGHKNFPGCFRCHDEEHATEGGETITQNCDNCHTLLAVEDESPTVLGEIFPEGVPNEVESGNREP